MVCDKQKHLGYKKWYSQENQQYDYRDCYEIMAKILQATNGNNNALTILTEMIGLSLGNLLIRKLHIPTRDKR